ncbi:chemotaxis protein CheY [Nostoc cycadae WK-1]|uniref:Chemotaxis protein CheY n=1 Tax=Nostoc cycadae WK-1 TaxID=1861711 RepID=A0A2H6LHJ0_9NOSO|nr:chemotaxis protein CheY [Nostoc cycadae WK-1]
MLKHSLARKRINKIIKQGTYVVQAAKFLDVDQSTLYVALQRAQVSTITKTRLSSEDKTSYISN